MAESTELTTRDVFAQIDRRLTRMEDDLRAFRQYIEERFVAMESRLEGRIDRLDDKIDRNLRWVLGMIMISWLSTMSAILLK